MSIRFSLKPYPFQKYLFLLVFIYPFWVMGNKDSIRKETIFTTIDQLNYTKSWKNFDDSSLNNFHLFDPLKNFNHFYSSLAGTGSPFIDKQYTPSFGSFNYPFAYQPALYFNLPENIPLFNTRTPFTFLQYIQGAKNLQQLQVIHSRNINPILNFTLSYNIMGFNGFYYNQKVNLSNFRFSANFHTPDNKYSVFTSFFSDKYHQNCNGGIVYDSFQLLSWQSRLVAPVALETARQFSAAKNLFLFHQLKLNPKDTGSDRQVYLGHRFNWHRGAYQYYDENPLNSYYPFIYHDSAVTNDSSHWQWFENRIFISRIRKSDEKPLFQAGFNHQSSLFRIHQTDSALFAFSAFVSSSIQMGIFGLNFYADYVLNGQNKNNYFTKIQPFIKIHKLYHLYSFIVLSRKMPAFNLQFADFNHLKWNYHFQPISESFFAIGIQRNQSDDKIEFQYVALKNQVYINPSLTAVQHPDRLNLLAVKLLKKLTSGHFHFDNHVAFQYSSDLHVFPLPQWAVNNLTYFDFRLFDNNLSLESGIDIRFCSPWYAPAYYAPANIFYVQTSTLVPFYPYSAIFINGKIKRGRVFLLLEQPHQYLFSNNTTYIIPGYPSTPLNFRFGISWSFYD